LISCEETGGQEGLKALVCVGFDPAVQLFGQLGSRGEGVDGKPHIDGLPAKASVVDKTMDNANERTTGYATWIETKEAMYRDIGAVFNYCLRCEDN